MNKIIPKILIVDDEPKNLHALRRVLAELEIEIVKASSGHEALKHVIRHDFFAVLMDVQMPDMDGFETTKIMLEDEKSKHTPIIFITAISKEDKFVFQGYDVGAVDYLFKPINENILIGKVKVFLDLYTKTRQLRLQDEAIHQAQKMATIGRLAGGIAHDFNNILGSIIGYSDLILRSTSKEDRNYEYQTKIHAGAMRAAKLVKQILTFSSQKPKDHIPVEINSVVKEAISLLRSTLPSSIDLQDKVLPGCGSVMGDFTQLHQIIMNLCTNASQALGASHGTIDVSASAVELDSEFVRFHPGLQEGRYLRLAISDTGCGMDEETIKRIFEPFFTTKGVGIGGTGLGLSVVHGIIRDHKGEIMVYSEINKGTTFHIYLPEHTSKIIVDSPTTKAEPISTGKESILLVDDNEMLLGTTKLMLESLGYNITTESDSLNALEIYRSNPSFDLIISDQTMPKLTGVELSVKIREISPNQPFIISSGFSDSVNKNNYQSFDIDGYVLKPFTVSEISEAISSVLDKIRS